MIQLNQGCADETQVNHLVFSIWIDDMIAQVDGFSSNQFDRSKYRSVISVKSERLMVRSRTDS